ncbi:formate/nitrite transporter family protein [Spiroplasma endosymbiont of Poecilobothrus nobilitatus]|uniref:formate/nitrite transporter family protein n=1 Tax=Spiroplasma endosymbiont of Poecilobothrus nobilitatus TaxID=1209220 RepID=UPI00313EBEFA
MSDEIKKEEKVDNSDSYSNEDSFVNIYKYALKKGNSPFYKTFLMGLAAGLFIGFGYIAAITAIKGNWDNIPIGLKSLVLGLVFTVAITMIVFLGGEMFTSNSLALIVVFKKQLNVGRFVSNLFIVLSGNFLGCLVMAGLTAWGGFLNHTPNSETDFYNNAVILINGKLEHKWWENFGSAILCNFLVAGSIYAAHTTKTAVAKFFVVNLIIMAFAISGFSHVVANSYLWFLQPFLKIFGTSGGWTDFGKFAYNVQLPTLIGNFLSGGIFLPFLYYFIYRKDVKEKLTL